MEVQLRVVAQHPEVEEADRELGQPDVDETPLEPGPTRAEIAAAAAAQEEAEQEQLQSFVGSGGLLAGQKLVVQGPDGGRTARTAVGRPFECELQTGSTVIVQRDWHPASGDAVLAAGSAGGASWLVGGTGSRIPGVWSVRPKARIRPFGEGAVGIVHLESPDADGGGQPLVQVYHWPAEVKVSADEQQWEPLEGLLGYIEIGRKVCVLAVRKELGTALFLGRRRTCC